MTDNVGVRIVAYLIIFILAFWCATIAAPIMWRLEYDREHWPKTVASLVESRAVPISRAGLLRSSLPEESSSRETYVRFRWKTIEGKERTGSYYGKPNSWYKPRENAEEQMFNHPIGTSFPCQYDPNFADKYRYIAEPGTFNTQAYLIWTIVMYSIAIPVCVLPCVGFLIYKLARKCDCSNSCKRKRRPTRTRGIAPPMSYTPPAPTTTFQTPAPVVEVPRPDPFAERADVEVPVNPILVPLSDVPTQVREEHVSSSESSNMPVY